MPHETTHRFLASELPVAEPESCLFHVLPVPLELRCRMPEGRRGARKPFLRLPISLNCGMANPSPPKRAFIRGQPSTFPVLRKPCSAGGSGGRGYPRLQWAARAAWRRAYRHLRRSRGAEKAVRDIRDHPVSTRTRTCATAMRGARGAMRASCGVRSRIWGCRWPSSA